MFGCVVFRSVGRHVELLLELLWVVVVVVAAAAAVVVVVFFCLIG